MEQEYIQLVGKQSFHTGIDLVGNTGSKILSVKDGEVTGDHLHFEMRMEDKSTVDPAPYLFTEV